MTMLRRARVQDAHAFSVLCAREIEHGLTHRWTPRRLGRLLERSDTNGYTLVQRAHLDDGHGGARTVHGCGGLSIATFADEHAHLVLHAVAPGLRRQGHGRQLLRWQIEAALTAGISSLSLELRAGNTPAYAFYRSMGFELVGRQRGYYDGREDACRLRLTPLRQTDSSPL